MARTTHDIECLPVGEIIERHAPDRALGLLTIDAECWISKIPQPGVRRSDIARLLDGRGYESFSRL